ncbi:MAG: hypothetical protein QXS54_10340 [Candidatus Methanomethylicaceae archaeon]
MNPSPPLSGGGLGGRAGSLPARRFLQHRGEGGIAVDVGGSFGRGNGQRIGKRINGWSTQRVRCPENRRYLRSGDLRSLGGARTTACPGSLAREVVTTKVLIRHGAQNMHPLIRCLSVDGVRLNVWSLIQPRLTGPSVYPLSIR